MAPTSAGTAFHASIATCRIFIMALIYPKETAI